MIYPSAEMIEYQRDAFEGTLPIACAIWWRADEDSGGQADFTAYTGGDTVCDVELVDLDNSPFNLDPNAQSIDNLRQISLPYDAPVRRGRRIVTAAATYDILDASTDDSDPLGVVVLGQKVGR